MGQGVVYSRLEGVVVGRAICRHIADRREDVSRIFEIAGERGGLDSCICDDMSGLRRNPPG